MVPCEIGSNRTRDSIQCGDGHLAVKIALVEAVRLALKDVHPVQKMMRLVHGSRHLTRHELIDQSGKAEQESQANEPPGYGRDRECPGSILSDRRKPHRRAYRAHAGIIARIEPLTDSHL